MRRTILSLGLALAVTAAFGWAPGPQQAAAKPDLTKILGNWSLDVDAGGEVITLNLVLEAPQGKLAGKISEPSGMFTDAPLANIEYDGENLAYDITVASPPDGAVKTWKTQLKVGADVVEGVIANADTGMSANV
ncbi:MAG TPA: hypothetical protein VEG35_03310, partial [Burkholderiales bacterium]|nr:hypothetical protein [Burkholderiales bacterium]